MERSPEHQDTQPEDELVAKARDELDRAEASGDETRLETLEKLRGELEAELDSSLEDDASRH